MDCSAPSEARTLLALLAGGLLLLAGAPARPASPASAAPEDAAAIRQLIDGFSASYARRDAAGVMALWSERAPEAKQYGAALETYFREHDQVRIEKVAIERMTVAGDRAQVRLVYERH